jgi:hypothetical protein
MDGKGIPQPVRTDVMHSASFRIDQMGQSRLLGTFLDDLPGAVAVDAKDEIPLPAYYRPTAFDVILQYSERILIQRQCSHPAVFLLFGHGAFHLVAALGTKAMTLPQPRATLIAGELYPCFKVLDGNSASAKINITCGNTQCLGDTTSKVK